LSLSLSVVLATLVLSKLTISSRATDNDTSATATVPLKMFDLDNCFAHSLGDEATSRIHDQPPTAPRDFEIDHVRICGPQ